MAESRGLCPCVHVSMCSMRSTAKVAEVRFVPSLFWQVRWVQGHNPDLVVVENGSEKDFGDSTAMKCINPCMAPNWPSRRGSTSHSTPTDLASEPSADVTEPLTSLHFAAPPRPDSRHAQTEGLPHAGRILVLDLLLSHQLMEAQHENWHRCHVR